MKSIAFFALSLVATAAMATGSTGVSTITISGSSTQTASVNGGKVDNTANSHAYANQNIASNKGGVSIGGTSVQTAVLEGAKVSNEAKSAGDVAVQNLASNVGHVAVNPNVLGGSYQSVYITGNATLKNSADSTSNRCSGPNCDDGALAYQNAASNMGDITITGRSEQGVGISGGSTSVTNTAKGANTVAVQNMSSNYGKVTVSGLSKQSTSISNGALLANLATGSYAHAYQNIASNDSCDPPAVVCVGPACGPYKLASH